MLDLEVQLLTLAASLAVMVVTWLISLRAEDASLADISWGLCFVAIAWTALVVGAGCRRSQPAHRRPDHALGPPARRLHRDAATTARTAATSGCARSRAARSRLRSLVTVFVLQAAIAWIVSAPVQVAATDGTPASIGALAVIGALVCLIGLACEATADFQLSRFLAEPDSSGRVMDRGIWRYSRHPNYFGDATFWWGTFLIALESGSAWWTAIGPLVMTTFLLKVSGVALTEKTISRRRPGYAEYVERTSPFIPLPPKRDRKTRR